jgi:hypothetical protein
MVYTMVGLQMRTRLYPASDANGVRRQSQRDPRVKMNVGIAG